MNSRASMTINPTRTASNIILKQTIFQIQIWQFLSTCLEVIQNQVFSGQRIKGNLACIIWQDKTFSSPRWHQMSSQTSDILPAQEALKLVDHTIKLMPNVYKATSGMSLTRLSFTIIGRQDHHNIFNNLLAKFQFLLKQPMCIKEIQRFRAPLNMIQQWCQVTQRRTKGDSSIQEINKEEWTSLKTRPLLVHQAIMMSNRSYLGRFQLKILLLRRSLF